MWAKKTANPLPNTTSRYETGVVFCEKRSLLFFNSATKKKISPFDITNFKV